MKRKESETIPVVWEIEDGYTGSRPHVSYVRLSDFDGMESEEISTYLTEIVDEAFVQNISPYIVDEDKIIGKIQSYLWAREGQGE